MSQPLASRAGSAISWRIVQLVGIKLIFLLRVFVLGRMLGPGEFGLFAVSLVALDFLLKITDFGMVPALVQHPGAERRHFDAAWTIGLLRAGLVGLAVFVAAPLVAELFKEPRATDLVRVLALRPLLEAGASIGVAQLTRQLRFRPLASIQFSDALVGTALSIALVAPLGVWALVAGPLAGALTSLIVSYLVAPHRPRFTLDTAAMLPLLRYGRWIFARALVAPLGTSILQLAISRQIGVAELGLYFLAGKVAFLPTEVASGVVGAVAFPLYARLQDNPRQATRTFQLILTGMLALLLPSALMLFVLAPELVEHVLGPRWEGTVPVIRVLVWVNVVGLLGDAIVPMLKGLGLPSKATLLGAVQSAVLILLAWELAGRFGAVGAGLTWLAATGASQILGMHLLRQLLPHVWVGMAPALMVVATASFAGAATAWAIVQLDAGLAGLLAAIAGGGSVTAGLLWILDRHLELNLARNLARAFPEVANAWTLVTGLPRAGSASRPGGGSK
ncbi:MAG TPA: lipopolysaccharide biosynthesis protein [Gemmatimonadales bacterium]|nr:lipopolysaccharide biosynthesis protein [Gemmatimonadales bacterium]